MPEVRVILLCAPLLFSGKFQVVAASPFPLEHYPRFLDSCPSLFPWYTGLLLLQLVEESICFSTWHSFRPHWCGHPCFRPQLSLLGRQIREEQSVGNWKAKVALQVRPWWQRYTKIDTKSYFVIRNVSITWWSLSIAVIGVSAGKGNEEANNAARQDDRQAVRRARDDKDIMVSSGWVSRWKECNKRTMASTFRNAAYISRANGYVDVSSEIFCLRARTFSRRGPSSNMLLIVCLVNARSMFVSDP